jgi:hypothetical protein
MSLGIKRKKLPYALSRMYSHYSGGGAPAGAILAFSALLPDATTYEMLGVKQGTGDLTTTHTSTIYGKDHENVYRAFAANEPVWEGGRVVTNEFQYSEDFSNAAWQQTTVTLTHGITDPLGGTTATRIEATGANSLLRQSYAWDVGKTPINSMWIRRVSGTGTVGLYGGSTGALDISGTLTTEWQRFVSSSVLGDGNARGGILIVTSGDIVEVAFAQGEKPEGRTDTTTPSEYIPTTTAPVTKVFANANGNTVSSNVVTEAVGTPLAEMPYLDYVPAATVSNKYSRDLSSVEWGGTGTNTYDQIGITGEANTATLLADAGAGFDQRRNSFAISADSNTHAMVTWVKKDTDETRFVGLVCNGYTNKGDYVALNTKTGYSWISINNGINTAVEVIDDGDWWKVCIQADNDGVQASFIAVIFPALCSAEDGAPDTNASGSCIIGNCQVHLNKTIAEVRGLPPIFTTTSATSTDATVYYFNIANFNQDGATYVEWSPTWDYDLATYHNILNPRDIVGNSYLYQNAGNIQSHDGTNTIANVETGYVAGDLMQLGIAHHGSDGLADINVDGLWQSEQTFDGAYITGTNYSIAKYNSTMRQFKMRNIKGYTASSLADAKAAIDGLMLNPPLEPAFLALVSNQTTFEMEGVQTGTGGLTTTHTSTIYAKDHENVYHAFGTNEPVWSGGRVVTNWFTYSEDFSNAAWIATGVTKVGATTVNGINCMEISFAGSIGTEELRNASARSLPGGNSQAGGSAVIVSATVRSVSGSTSARLVTWAGAGGISSDISINETWQRITFAADTASSVDCGSAGMRINNALDTSNLYVANFQIEYARGRSDTTTTSEYVATTSATATKVFANANGNTVTNNVVTEAVGTPLAEIPYLDYVPAATNSQPYSNDQANLAWTAASATAVQDEVGLTGEANTACTLDDPGAGNGFLGYAFTGSTTTNALKVWIKKDNDETRFPCIAFIDSNHLVHINTKTGATVEEGSSGYSHEVVSDGDWWIVMLEAVDGTAPDVRVYPARGSVIGTADVNATGSCIVGNVELYLNKTIVEVRGLPPIFTTTAAVSTDATVYTFDNANHADAGGAYYAEIQMTSTDEAMNIVGASNIDGTSGGKTIMYWSGQLVGKDASNNAVTYNPPAVTPYTTVQVGSVYHAGEGKNIVNADGTYGAEGIYSGTMFNLVSSPLAVMHVPGGTLNQAAKIRNLYRYDTTSFAEGKTTIDGLMA